MHLKIGIRRGVQNTFKEDQPQFYGKIWWYPEKKKIKTHDTLSNDTLHKKGHILLGIIVIMRYKHYLGICW